MDDSRKTCSYKVECSSHRLLANGFDLNFNSEDEACHEHCSINIHRSFSILQLLQLFEGPRYYFFKFLDLVGKSRRFFGRFFSLIGDGLGMPGIEILLNTFPAIG